MTRHAEPVLSMPADTAIQTGADAPLDHIMASMRAMRRLSPEPVDPELIEELIRAATFAPSASNAQNYSYVVVTDRAKMGELAQLWRSCHETYQAMAGIIIPEPTDPVGYQRMQRAVAHQADHFADTPVLIAACHRTLDGGKAFVDPRNIVAAVRRIGFRRFYKLARAGGAAKNVDEGASIYPGVQNLLLAARARGLAANVTIWHVFQEADWRDALGVPDDHGIYALIPIGWPTGRFGPVRRRPVDEAIHWNTWGGRR
jgi:nitroreductase